MTSKVTVGEVTCETGNKAKGFMKVTDRPSSAVKIPVFIINGASSGPRLFVTAAIHGDEHEGPQALYRLARTIDPKKLKGVIVALPIVNTLAFDACQRASPVDNLDMNRAFPGKPDGFMTEQVAYNVFDAMKKNADFSLDLHSGGSDIAQALQTIYCEVGNQEKDRISKEMAEAFTTSGQILMVMKGTLLKGTISIEAARVGIPSMVGEAGDQGVLVMDQVDIMYEGILNLLRYLEMIPEKALRSKGYEYAGEDHFIRCKHGGYLHPLVQLRQKVMKDSPIAKVTDILGNEVEEIRSPIKGVITAYRTLPAVSAGDRVVLVAEQS